ncbi:MAG TPA: RNA pseudouridine synthase [Pirellulaceae bacterium]|nr:RNA pseudouridine synthase [Pirellulaceae bacterium]HMO92724.1 RNA pseudouridine synthase [Pirellulaceae bacterium]HMP70276.1 RNA pseudouridine synthase [Pirellulaceae bacterium]
MFNETPQLDLPEPDVLYHQHRVLLVNKPGGLLTQAPPGIDSLELRIKRWQIKLGKPEKKYYLGVPHRLDRPASGVMVFATDRKTTNQLCKQFEARTVQKTYWAIVSGDVEPVRAQWSDWMCKVPDEARSEIVAASSNGAQLAVLNYRVLARKCGFSLLEISLETGRTHQIRLQTSNRGFPIVGDELYGSHVEFGAKVSDPRRRPIALHARSISLIHPVTQQPLQVSAEPPAAWCDVQFQALMESASG